MSSHAATLGTKIALDLRVTSRKDTYGLPKLESLQNLLDVLSLNPSQHLPMLRSTARLFGDFCSKPCSDVTLKAVDENREEQLAPLGA
jgi:hypothetical protein